MALVTNKPGLSLEDSKRYFEINQEIFDKRRELEQTPKEEKKKIRKLEDEINQLLMEQVMMSNMIS